MILDRQFERLTFLPDNVVYTFDDIADCEVHSVCFTESLAKLSRCPEELACIDPLLGTLIDEVPE
jgi:hypothetical protein